MKKLYLKLSKGKVDLIRDNWKQLTYEGRMSGPFAVGEQQSTQMRLLTQRKRVKKSKAETAALQCQHCKLFGHTRTNSMACLKNPKKIVMVMSTKDIVAHLAKARKKGMP